MKKIIQVKTRIVSMMELELQLKRKFSNDGLTYIQGKGWMWINK